MGNSLMLGPTPGGRAGEPYVDTGHKSIYRLIWLIMCMIPIKKSIAGTHGCRSSVHAFGLLRNRTTLATSIYISV